MKKTWLLALGLILVAGCGPKGENASGKEGEPSTPGMTAGATLKGDLEKGKATGDVEVQAFKGGFGIDFYQKAAEEWAKENPGVKKVTVDGDARVWEKLKPRLVSGDAPDLMFPGWGMDHWGLADEGQLMVLDQALDSPSYDGSGTWRTTFDESILKLGKSDGKQFVLPYYFSVMGWWYDPGVFAKNGWTVPKTWDELLALCEKIKAAGIAPITYQGQYPDYMVVGMLMPWAYSIGGEEAFKSMQNLEPGAWKSEPVLKAAQMIDELNKKGYFQNGATGLSHTQSQTEFLLGHAAMIPCGTWLYSEMEKVMPKGAKMQFMLPPVVSGGKGDASAIAIKIEPWMVPSKGKNPEAAVSLFKYMTSVEKAKQFVTEKGTLMAIKGSDQVKLPEVLVEPAAKLRGTKSVWANQVKEFYPDFYKELENALTEMLNGNATPEQFCERVEKKADEVRNDPEIKKWKI